ncbi:GNAT family N-acetyltransferase [Streptomyces griseorubiginosus]|uniref:GNAT family N-acetyltransferase n=1 Tax=Streptomyces griseorubiginosus TaxID=67304 RepID=UPI001AD74D6D|nr:GNAT family N-acetyltransferase [Streptomyces griseorubiginosus]MBO4259195.1 GNAT family N-acetyltransferase [Streptomyces griseorubiginosus]
MTTTLRPTEPLQRHADGTQSRHYQVCVNSRPVGGIRLSTDPGFGPTVARLTELRIEEPDRRRGRGTVAVLAAEEIARAWGCKRVEAPVPGEAEGALRLATALGYVRRSRNMVKRLGTTPPELPTGSSARPMTEAEYGPWIEYESEHYVRSMVERGVSAEEARKKADEGHAKLLPDGLASENTVISVLEHEGVPVGTLWVGLWSEMAYVLDVEADARHRGRGHGRALMLLAEIQAIAAGKDRIGLHVFAGNAPAERLYESLGYETTSHNLQKDLI